MVLGYVGIFFLFRVVPMFFLAFSALYFLFLSLFELLFNDYSDPR